MRNICAIGKSAKPPGFQRRPIGLSARITRQAAVILNAGGFPNTAVSCEQKLWLPDSVGPDKNCSWLSHCTAEFLSAGLAAGILRLFDTQKPSGRTPAALSMKLGNIASLDPAITSTGRAGLRAASANDRAMWDEMQSDWERFAIESEQALSEVQVRAGLDRETSQDDIPPTRVGEDRIYPDHDAHRSKFLPQRSSKRLQRKVLHYRTIVADLACSKSHHPMEA